MLPRPLKYNEYSGDLSAIYLTFPLLSKRQGAGYEDIKQELQKDQTIKL